MSPNNLGVQKVSVRNRAWDTKTEVQKICWFFGDPRSTGPWPESRPESCFQWIGGNMLKDWKQKGPPDVCLEVHCFCQPRPSWAGLASLSAWNYKWLDLHTTVQSATGQTTFGPPSFVNTISKIAWICRSRAIQTAPRPTHLPATLNHLYELCKRSKTCSWKLFSTLYDVQNLIFLKTLPTFSYHCPVC